MTEEPELPSSRTTPTHGSGAAEPRLPSDGAGATPVSAPADVAPVAPETMHTRIARVTAAGGLRALPPGFDEREGDWESVRSDNPFEVLYLDHEQAPRISGEAVETHYRLLHELWSGKKLRMHSGAAGRQIALRYGGEDKVDGYPKLVENAYRRLSTPEGRAQEFKRIDDARRERGERAIAKTVTAYLADGLLDPSETDAILVDGTEAGLRLDETAAYLEDRLASGGFRADATPMDGTPAQRLASVSWRTAKRRADDDARRASGGVVPLKFEQGAAGSLAELAALCDRFPKEAEGYLYRGYFEAWLSGRLGDAPMAAQVREARIGNADDGSKGLEVAVRAFLKQTGTVPEVAVRAAPASVRFGELPMGAEITQRVELTSEGRARTWGTARLDTPVPGLSFTPTFENPGGVLTLTLDTTSVAPGDYATSLVIEPVGAPVSTRVPVAFRVVALALHPEPARLDLGTMPFGAARTSQLTVATTPVGGRLVGSAALTNSHPGVRLDGAIAGGSSQLTVAVDSRQFRAGDRYESTVRVQTNAGVIEVPITFRVGLRSGLVIGWTAAAAVLGGGTLWFARELLAIEGGFAGWFASIAALRGLSPTQAIAATLLCAMPLGLGWYFRRRARQRGGSPPPTSPEGMVGASGTPTGSPALAETDASAAVASPDAKSDLATPATRRGNPWPLISVTLLALTAYLGLRYPDGQAPIFWTLVAATFAGLLGWRRGQQVRRGRKRSATLVMTGGLAAALAYSGSVWSVSPAGQWQPFAEWAWSLGVSAEVARGLGPSGGVRRSIEREVRGDRQGAIREAMEAAASRDDDGDAWILLTAYHLEAGDLDRAYAAALSARTARPANGLALSAVGTVLLARGQDALAMRALRTAVTRDPGSEAANLVYGCQLAGDESTANSGSLFLRRAAAASRTAALSTSGCQARSRPYTSARWWAATLVRQYSPVVRAAAERVASLPLPPMPDSAGVTLTAREGRQ